MMPAFSQDVVYFMPELVLLLGALAGLCAGVFLNNGYETTLRISYLALFIAAVWQGLMPASGQVSFGMHFEHSGVTVFAKQLIVLAAAGALTLSHHAFARLKVQQFEFPVLILLSTLGMCLMVSARDMLALYVGIELQSLALYIMAAYVRKDDRGAEAGLKYFVLGALSSGILLYGISLLYGATGTIQYDGLERFIASGQPSMPVILATVFMLAALAFKISAAPFHMWTPDVYEGAATPITAFFTTASKVAGSLVLLQFLHGPLAGAGAVWGQIIWACAALSLIVGAFAALLQTDLKRLLAYSTINHVGFLLIAILSGGIAGISALLMYLAVYVAISLGTFGVILWLQQQGEVAESLTDLRGIARRRPRAALALAVLIFAAAGVPPTAGFMGKMFVLLAAMQAGYVWLAVLGVITSVVATFYYLRVIKVMYFDEDSTGQIFPVIRLSRRLVALVVMTIAFVLGMMLMPSLLVNPATQAAEMMVRGAGH